MNRMFQSTIRAAFVLAAFTLSGSAFAQATRTWVSGVGDDVNPCSRTAPCKTFAGAISKTAAGGEINVLDSGGFGTVTITKSITIDGQGAYASILASSTYGVTVNGAGVNVILRNISINGAGSGSISGIHGIRFLNGSSLTLENVQIFGFTQNGIDFTPSATAELFVSNSTINNMPNATFGAVRIKPGAGASVMASFDNVKLLNSNFGLRIEDRVTANVSNSVITGNGNNGLLAITTAAAAELSVDNSIISNNGSSVIHAGINSNGSLSTVNIANNTITNNGTGLLSVAGGDIISLGNNNVTGNGTDGSPTSTVSTR